MKKTMFRHITNLFFISLISTPTLALQMNQTSYYIPPNKSNVNASIFNAKPEMAYAIFNITEITNPRTKNEKEKEIDLSKSDAPMAITPSQLVVRPESSTDFRIFSIDTERSKDRYFVIEPKQVYGTPLKREEQNKKNNKTSANIGLSISLASIVVVPKQNPTYITKINEKDGLTITNNGDSVVLIENLYTCDENEENCSKAISYRLFPNETKNFCHHCKTGYKVEYDLTEGNLTQHKKSWVQ
jgi:hypothetical protein